MSRTLWKVLGQHTLCGAAVLLAAGLVQAQGPSLPPIPQPTIVPAAAQEAPRILPIQLKDAGVPQLVVPPHATNLTAAPPAPNVSDKARIDQLERKIQELTEAIKATQGRPIAAPAPVDANQSGGLTAKDVQQMINSYFAAKQADQPPTLDEKQRSGVKVGSDMAVQAKFMDGGYLFMYTPNKDFTMHIGGWFQYDSVFWDQTPAMRKVQDGRSSPKQGVASGASQGGIGTLEDGEYWRRIRPLMEGTFYENGEYRFNIALENDTLNTTGLDEFWMGWNNIPFIGTIRVGHVKTPMGLEADMTASSRSMTFMERSSYSEAIEQNQNFVSGVWLGNAYLCQRLTWQATPFFRSDSGASTGTFFGDGQWGSQGRITALPLYEDEGRTLLHLGWSGGYRNGVATNGTANNNTSLRTFTLQARPELRDDDPAAIAAAVNNSDDSRMVSTGAIIASRMYITGLEALFIRGPFSVQAEYGWNFVQDATGFAPGGPNNNIPATVLKSPQNYVFNGGYVQLAYTLTGENRAYDKQIGTLARYYYGNQGPRNPFWLVRDENGRFRLNTGAWEIAARYSYLDLNDGTGANRVQGGAMDGISLALNWYLNKNLNVMFDWSYDHRYDVPVGVIPGYTSGFGVRVQMSF